jgi:hypothetical protein
MIINDITTVTIFYFIYFYFFIRALETENNLSVDTFCTYSMMVFYVVATNIQASECFK